MEDPMMVGRAVTCPCGAWVPAVAGQSDDAAERSLAHKASCVRGMEERVIRALAAMLAEHERAVLSTLVVGGVFYADLKMMMAKMPEETERLTKVGLSALKEPRS